MTNLEIPSENRFIEYLIHLSQEQNRGILAVLRRGLSQPPAADVNMYPHVARFVNEKERGTQREKIYYLIAALFAYHPLFTHEGNFGRHMRLAAGDVGLEAAERRFTALLNAHADDLPDYLRQAISYLRSKEVAVNWEVLFKDLKNWEASDRFIQRSWANSFWGYAPAGQQANQEKENN